MDGKLKIQHITNDIINCQLKIDKFQVSSFKFQDKKIKHEIQHSIPIFRPPYGKIKISQIRHLTHPLFPSLEGKGVCYKIYLWSVISYDFDSKYI